MGKKVKVEVIGPNPSCPRCTAVYRNAEKAASTLKAEGIDTELGKLDIMSKDVISKYGVLMSPALAVDGKVRTMGRIPNALEIEKLLREAAK